MDSNKNTSLEKEIGEKIGKLRVSNNETQEQLADSVGVSREIIQHWERGSRHIKADHIRTLAEHFSVSTDFLLGLPSGRSVRETEEIIRDYTGLTKEAIERIHELHQRKLMNIELDIPTEFPDIDILSLLLSGSYYSPLDSVLSSLASYPFKVRTVNNRLHELLDDAQKAYDNRMLDKGKLARECNACATNLDIAEFGLYRSTMAIIEVARKMAEKEVSDAKEIMEELQVFCL